MTTADDLKAALGAWVDETETNILGVKSGLGSVDATVSRAALISPRVHQFKQ